MVVVNASTLSRAVALGDEVAARVMHEAIGCSVCREHRGGEQAHADGRAGR